jgi:hypothetical protein
MKAITILGERKLQSSATWLQGGVTAYSSLALRSQWSGILQGSAEIGQVPILPIKMDEIGLLLLAMSPLGQLLGMREQEASREISGSQGLQPQ